MKSPIIACLLASSTLGSAQSAHVIEIDEHVALLRESLAINSRQIDPFGLPQSLLIPRRSQEQPPQGIPLPNLSKLRIQAIIGDSALLEGQVLELNDRFRITQNNHSYTLKVVQVRINSIVLQEARTKRLLTIAGPEAPKLRHVPEDTLELPDSALIPAIPLP